MTATTINKTDAKRSMVFISLEPWDDVWRRNQFVCRELAQRGWQILFVEPAADWSAGLRRRDWSQFERREPWSPQGLPSIRVVRPVKVLPKSSALGRRINIRLLQQAVEAYVSKSHTASTILWVNDQQAWPLAARAKWKKVIYDITDDWTKGFANGRLSEQITHDDQALRRFSDDVIVCSEQLAERVTDQDHQARLIANGVDVDAYANIAGTEKNAESRSWRAPVLGYTGTLHPERLDLKLLDKLATVWPGSIALVGPDHLGKQGEMLSRHENVKRIGPVPYRDLPSWMAAMDVMIVPHRVTPFTQSLNPLKLWEYLAAGLPIVSTPVAGFADFPQFVRLAEGEHDFIAACRDALNEPAELGDARRREASSHSWSSRVDEIEHVLHMPRTAERRLASVS